MIILHCPTIKECTQAEQLFKIDEENVESNDDAPNCWSN